MNIKSVAKQTLQRFPYAWKAYFRSKTEILRIINLRYFFYDIYNSYNYMNWTKNKLNKDVLSAELLFQYHKLEKGLVMPGAKRLFGLEPARKVMELIQIWEQQGYTSKNSVLLGALGTLQCYRDRVSLLDPEKVILSDLDVFLRDYDCQKAAFSTPMNMVSIDTLSNNAVSEFKNLMNARRSVRDFESSPVSESIVREAISVAQLSPSACNRQPWEIQIVNNCILREQLLSHQNGNRGFGHLAPHVAVILADEECFFGVSERHEPYIDGGLFAMSFILALKSQGVSSCCLNWCVRPKTDKTVHKLLGLKPSLRIVMLVAFGYAPNGTLVPKSQRRNTNDIVSFIN